MSVDYRVLNDRVIRGEKVASAGDVVRRCTGYDYGCANDDTYFTGVQHVSVTHEVDGGYPFFTIPLTDLETVADESAAKDSTQ